MHVTHHIPKIEEGTFVEGQSGGSLQMFLRFAKEENGLDPATVWRNVKLTMGLFMLGIRDSICDGSDLHHTH